MSEELKPCPFCGSEALIYKHPALVKKFVCCQWGEFWAGNNKKCPNGSLMTIEEWNSRPIEDALTVKYNIADYKLSTARLAIYDAINNSRWTITNAEAVEPLRNALAILEKEF